MWWRKCGPIGPPPWENGGSSGRGFRTRSLMVSLEPPWKDASIDTPNTLIRGPWGRQNSFSLNQRYSGRRCRTRPPMVSLKPPWKYASIETPHTLIRGPWGRQDHFDTLTIFPAKSIGLKEPLPLGIVVIYNTVILSRGLYMTYTLSMVQKKIIYRLIRPKLSNVMISKQAWDTSWGIPNFWQYLALRTFRVFYILRVVWPKGPTPVRERVKGHKYEIYLTLF
jgi:hypothetical protein